MSQVGNLPSTRRRAWQAQRAQEQEGRADWRGQKVQRHRVICKAMCFGQSGASFTMGDGAKRPGEGAAVR